MLEMMIGGTPSSKDPEDIIGDGWVSITPLGAVPPIVSQGLLLSVKAEDDVSFVDGLIFFQCVAPGQIWIYNEELNTWALSSSTLILPQTNSWCRVGNILYMSPGTTSITKVDLTTFISTTLTSAGGTGVTNTRSGTHLAHWEGKLYLTGGTTSGPTTYYPDHYSFDLTTRIWTKLLNCPYPRSSGRSESYDGKIYVSGAPSSNNGLPAAGTFSIYHVASDSWTESTRQPTTTTFSQGDFTRTGTSLSGAKNGLFVTYSMTKNTWKELTVSPSVQSQKFATTTKGLYAYQGYRNAGGGFPADWINDLYLIS